MTETTYHIPALLTETVSGLNVRPDGVYVDVTFGGGGHSRAIIQNLTNEGHLFSFDQDRDALTNEEKREASGESCLVGDPRWTFVHSNFRYLRNFMAYHGVSAIDGLMADLGVSFHHFDEAERGFSFRFAGPLDMRMNQRGGKTAADILNTYDEEELARVLYTYGELKNSRPLARKMVAARPLTRIEELVKVVTGKCEIADGAISVDPRAKKELTCVFQALRIEVNDELGALREMLEAARDLLKPGGRIAILTYHSLEDRIVKNFLRSGNLNGEIEKDFYGNILTPFKVIEKGATASEEEVARNPRARSAKLRVAEKLQSEE